MTTPPRTGRRPGLADLRGDGSTIIENVVDDETVAEVRREIEPLFVVDT